MLHIPSKINKADTTNSSTPILMTKLVNNKESNRITLEAEIWGGMSIDLVKNTSLEGYPPRIDVGDPNVFLGEALVTNKGKTCHFMAVNANEYETHFEVFPRELLPYDIYEPDSSEFLRNKDAKTAPSTVPEKRVEKILQNRPLEHLLNSEEEALVYDMDEKYIHIFFRPGDTLPTVKGYCHGIPTIDDTRLIFQRKRR